MCATDLLNSPDLKEICLKLNCYKTTKSNIITRCIYCNDSSKKTKNHGHFYIWNEFPIAHCFRCGIVVRLEKWLFDLNGLIDDLLLSNLRKIININFLTRVSSSDIILIDNNEPMNSSIIPVKLDDDNLNIIKKLFDKRGIKNEKIIEYMRHQIINLELFKNIENDEYYIGLKSLFKSGFHLRNVKSSNVIQKKLIPNDIYIMGNNFLGNNLYIVEGLFDAISLLSILMDETDNFKLTDYTFIISNVSSHLKSLIKYLSLNVPENINIIYDNDVSKKITTIHKKMLNSFLKSYSCNCHFLQTTTYKDINEYLINNKGDILFSDLVSI